MVGLQCSDKSREAVLDWAQWRAWPPCPASPQAGAGPEEDQAPGHWHPLTPPNSESDQAHRLNEPLGVGQETQEQNTLNDTRKKTDKSRIGACFFLKSVTLGRWGSELFQGKGAVGHLTINCSIRALSGSWFKLTMKDFWAVEKIITWY